MTPQEFIAAIGPAAQASMLNTGVPASFSIADGALESAWGQSQLAIQACNLFGVKADAAWKGDVLQMNTREFLNGQWVKVPAKWRKYADWQGCIDDHARFLLTNRRYLAAFERKADVTEFTKAIAAAGYATDPQYANKILSIIRTHGLIVFDKPAAKGPAA